MINKVLLEGRIVRDFEVRIVGNDLKTATFVLANTNQASKDKRTDFIPCVVFGKQAEVAERFLRKGSLVSVEGSLYVNSQKLEDGTYKTYFNVQCHRIHFLESKPKEENPMEREPIANPEFNMVEEQEDYSETYLSSADAEILDSLPF